MGLELEQVKNLGSYQLLEPLGQGGMGEVWRAKHRYLAREAAVKLIGTKGKQTEAMQKRFEREAQATARLESPHTVSIFDFGSTPEGQLYFAMELIRGLNLHQLVQRYGPQPAGRVRNILVAVLRSLEEAHAAGLVHRDIKPSNILLGRLGVEHDFVKVVDFGLVKVAAEEGLTQLTLDQQALGTPSFMAPELAGGEEEQVDGRADLYALGCVGYWLLTGRNVFEGPTPMAILLKHLQEPVTAPSAVTELRVDRDLERMVLWCLEKDPEKRPRGARELRLALEALRMEGEWDAERAADWWRTNLPALA
jgi:serine/threonine-protein kinase